MADEYDNTGLPGPEAESDEEDEYYENPVELIKEFGTHPLMERAQKALTEQLKATQYKLQVTLLEKEEDLKRQSQDRESLGVQLYSLQQQLARIQITFEGAHNDYNRIVDTRLQEEEMLRNINKENNEQNELINEHKKQYKKYSTELDSLNETIQQIEKYNQEVKSEIALTRRSTYKAEQSMQILEKHKAEQDTYVDGMNKTVKNLQEQIALYSGQYQSQKSETDDAKGVIDETKVELETIAREKRGLMIQWKSALNGLSRRDEALSKASYALATAQRAVSDYDVEIESTRREIQQTQAKHESLVSLRDRLENEMQWVEENLTKIKTERDQLEERYTLLTKSLTQTDGEAKKLDGLAKQLVTEAESLLQNLQVVTQERQKVEEQVNSANSMHSQTNKAVENFNKEIKKMITKVHEKENDANEIENDIARTKVDRLNASSFNDQLREQHGAVMKELGGKENMISKYQLEIRQRTDEIEKKMYRVDRLNKKYDKMIESAGGEENLGPLENTIRNLNKETDSTLEECKELERDWLRRQTELVTATNEGDDISEVNNELQARITILTQQQLRLTRSLSTLQQEVKDAISNNVNLTKDVAKLNILISSNHDQEGHLQHENWAVERACVEELKEIERECVQLEASVNEIRVTKTTILDEIMEAERQALLWEKKIQLDKDTRAALDPSIGQGESQAMEREIHRMELRFDALKREQERLAVEMEKAIHKRSAISNRYQKPPGTKTAEKKGASKGSKELTQASAKKKIGALKKEARVLAEETSNYNSAIEERKAQLHEMTSELERVTSQYGQQEEQSHNLQGDINDLLYNKQLNQERIAYRQKFCKRLRDLSQTGVDNTQTLQVERRLLSASQALENVSGIVNDLQVMHPHLSEVLSRVAAMASPGF
jgi:coiled-coil domain-containing protein 40